MGGAREGGDKTIAGEWQAGQKAPRSPAGSAVQGGSTLSLHCVGELSTPINSRLGGWIGGGSSAGCWSVNLSEGGGV